MLPCSDGFDLLSTGVLEHHILPSTGVLKHHVLRSGGVVQQLFPRVEVFFEYFVLRAGRTGAGEVWVLLVQLD